MAPALAAGILGSESRAQRNVESHNFDVELQHLPIGKARAVQRGARAGRGGGKRTVADFCAEGSQSGPGPTGSDIPTGPPYFGSGVTLPILVQDGTGANQSQWQQFRRQPRQPQQFRRQPRQPQHPFKEPIGIPESGKSSESKENQQMCEIVIFRIIWHLGGFMGLQNCKIVHGVWEPFADMF